MKKYRLTVTEVLNIEVSAESADEAYDKYHNRDEYDHLDYVSTTTDSIAEIES